MTRLSDLGTPEARKAYARRIASAAVPSHEAEMTEWAAMAKLGLTLDAASVHALCSNEDAFALQLQTSNKSLFEEVALLMEKTQFHTSANSTARHFSAALSPFEQIRLSKERLNHLGRADES